MPSSQLGQVHIEIVPDVQSLVSVLEKIAETMDGIAAIASDLAYDLKNMEIDADS